MNVHHLKRKLRKLSTLARNEQSSSCQAVRVVMKIYGPWTGNRHKHVSVIAKLNQYPTTWNFSSPPAWRFPIGGANPHWHNAVLTLGILVQDRDQINHLHFQVMCTTQAEQVAPICALWKHAESKLLHTKTALHKPCVAPSLHFYVLLTNHKRLGKGYGWARFKIKSSESKWMSMVQFAFCWRNEILCDQRKTDSQIIGLVVGNHGTQ